MRESKFIVQNQEKWQQYEAGIRNNSLNANEMEHAFVELNDDLAFARTFYRNRAVRLFLNNLLAPVHTRIFSVRKWNLKALTRFFTYDAPLMNFQARNFILVSFIIVMLGYFIGYFSCKSNMDFASVILGEDYVQMTEYNISRGDPLAVYKHGSPGEMFSYIATNNLEVAMYFFLFGALFCVGTMYLLLSNGIMLGAFTYLFTSKGLTTEYLLTVYQHGTLEMLSMVVEGAAGLMMGAGFLFPGTRTRLRAIQDNARKSILMFLVCIPVIILAAFIESYLTRFTEIPDALRIAVIGLSIVFMFGYFIFLPWYKFRKEKNTEGRYDTLTPDTLQSPEPGRIYPIGRITLFAFDYFKKHAGKILLICITGFFILYPLANWLTTHAIADDISFQRRQFENIFSGETESNSGTSLVFRMIFFNFYATKYIYSIGFHPSLAITSFLLIFSIVFLLFLNNRVFIKLFNGQSAGMKKMLIAAFTCAFFQVLLNWLSGPAWWFSVLVLLPVQILISTVYLLKNDSTWSGAFLTGIGYVFSGFGKYISTVLVAALLYFLLMAGLSWLVINILNNSMQFHGTNSLSESILIFYAKFNYFIVPLFSSILVYIYFLMAASVIESRSGQNLKEKIQSIHFRKEVYGIETE